LYSKFIQQKKCIFRTFNFLVLLQKKVRIAIVEDETL